MCHLLESIRVMDGVPCHLDEHQERLNRARFEVLGLSDTLDLSKNILMPPHARVGTFKCRIIYSHSIIKQEFIPAQRREIRSLKIIIDNHINYDHK